MELDWMPEIRHAVGLRKFGTTPAGNPSDKLWAAFLIQHDTSYHQFVSIWGKYNGSLTPTLHAKTTPSKAAFDYQTAIIAKRNEGYEHFGWATHKKLVAEINKILTPPKQAVSPAEGYSFTIDEMNAIAKSAQGSGLSITGYYSGTGTSHVQPVPYLPEPANCVFCIESKALDDKNVCKCGHSRYEYHLRLHGMNSRGFHGCALCSCKGYTSPVAKAETLGAHVVAAIEGTVRDLPCDCKHWLNVHATKALDPNLGCLVSTCNCEAYRRTCVECFQTTRTMWRHTDKCVTGRREKPKQQEDQSSQPAKQPRRITHLLPDDL